METFFAVGGVMSMGILLLTVIGGHGVWRDR